MEKFNFLPQLILAYNKKDNDGELIHIKKANSSVDYYCPCCGNVVRARALNENAKVQSHYYHLNGDCSRESQVHWFCKNWLFEKECEFFIDNDLFKVDSVEIEKSFNTPFGNYTPDITVQTTSGDTIFFEVFFRNRKKDNEYFCKWDYLKIPVVEVTINEFEAKINYTDVQEYKYLYNPSKPFSDDHYKYDVYYNTIYKRKTELLKSNIKDYIERSKQLDWFWKMICNKEDYHNILLAISAMCYEDEVFCYNVTKNKSCVTCLKDDIKKDIFKKVKDEIKMSLDKNNLIQDDDYINLDVSVSSSKIKIIVYMSISNENVSFYKEKEIRTFNLNVLKTDNFSMGYLSDDNIRQVKLAYNKLKKYENMIMDLLNYLSKTDYKFRINNYNLVLLSKDNNGDFEEFINMSIYKYIDSSDIIQYIKDKENRKTFLLSLSEYFNMHSTKQSIKKFCLKNNCNIDEYDDETGILYCSNNFVELMYEIKELSLDSAFNYFRNELNKSLEKENVKNNYVKLLENNKNNKIWKFENINKAFDVLLIDSKTKNKIVHEFIWNDEWSTQDEFEKLLVRSMNKLKDKLSQYGYYLLEV